MFMNIYNNVLCCDGALGALQDLYNSFLGVNILSIHFDPVLL